MNIKLSEVLSSLESGGRPKGGALNDGVGIPSLGAEHLDSNGGFNFKSVKYIPEGYFQSLRNGKIESENILIVKDGATTGKVSFVNENFPFIESAVNEHVFLLKIDKSKASAKYIFQYLRTPQGQRNILRDFRGETVGGISRGFVDFVSFPLPSLSDQNQIANILSKAETLIEQRKQSIALLDELLKSSFLEMFGDTRHYSKNNVVKTVGEVCYCRGGGTPSKAKPEYYSGNVPWVSPKDMKWLYIITSQDKITEQAVKESSTTLIPKGAVLMVIRSGILKSKLPLAINKVDVTINQDMKAFSSTEITSEYLLYFFICEGKNILQKVKGTTADNLNFDDVKKLKIKIPPIELQTQFAHLVEKTEALKERYKNSLQELKKLYGSLSQQAFKGQLQFDPEEVTCL